MRGRHLLKAASVVVLASLCGCGLIIVPSVKTLPERAMRKVVVTDAETGSPMNDARVQFGMSPWLNWFTPRPALWYLADESPKTTTEPSDRGLVWDGERIGEGAFRIKTRTRLGYAWVWFPIGLPLGGVLFRTWQGSLIVTAPGHCRMVIDSGLASAQGDVKDLYFGGNPPATECLWIERDRVRVALPRRIPHRSPRAPFPAGSQR